jgi:HNH endonuclease
MGDYKKMLASPYWQRRRLEIFLRDKFSCRFCGNKEEELHVHHLVYHKDKKPWQYDDSFIVTACYKCHELEHKYRWEAERALNLSFAQIGFSFSDLDKLTQALKDNDDVREFFIEKVFNKYEPKDVNPVK